MLSVAVRAVPWGSSMVAARAVSWVVEWAETSVDLMVDWMVVDLGMRWVASMAAAWVVESVEPTDDTMAETLVGMWVDLWAFETVGASVVARETWWVAQWGRW